MPKIAETIELTIEEYKKMDLIQKRMNLSINEFINKAVKEKIKKNEYPPEKTMLDWQIENLKKRDLVSYKWCNENIIKSRKEI